MVATNLKPHTMNINNKMISAVKSSRMKYEAQLDKVRKEKRKESANQQQEILAKEILELQVKKENLFKAKHMLDDEFVTSTEG